MHTLNLINLAIIMFTWAVLFVAFWAFLLGVPTLVAVLVCLKFWRRRHA